MGGCVKNGNEQISLLPMFSHSNRRRGKERKKEKGLLSLSSSSFVD